MWRSTSIFIQISILFAIAFASFLAVALFYVKVQPRIESIKQYNIIVAAIGKIRQYNASMESIKNFLEEENFYEVPITDYIQEQIKQEPAPHPGSFSVSVIQDGNDIFIVLRTMDNFVVYQDPIAFNWSKYHMLTFIGALILIIIYITLMKRLMPLSHIKNELAVMANENEIQPITWGAKNHDEIGELVREFNRSVEKLNAVSEARTLFLRSIMHELKTPITKGRIVAEMVVDSKQKQRLCDVFERLNSLIDEFAKIEQLASKKYMMKKTEIPLQEIVKEAMQMLLIDPNNNDSIIFLHSNDLVKADFHLFTLCIKNLLDNGIKYSIDSKVIIESSGKDLIVKNRGEKLKLDINEYFKPYFKDMKNPLSQGFGLGMYIIKTTLDTQNFELEYLYEDGYNQFIIKKCIVENFCRLDNMTKG
ncbi:ArsS family sensor histidine kinase [Helicobacter trogontum]|uniref:histidine kinase n=1 Tax=Helicobacter trogontum TaxID=50960 RepID=A0A4U8SAT0_9HELI|nr:ArsS family sensor histidine kinase [Helicobacter trogontum]MCI5786304.1 ArsS family sensor histidine kinase [Helicobacter trogontum]TLD83140.1 HAMP domain-containing histidine kinase [Helicobacter trogontum]